MVNVTDCTHVYMGFCTFKFFFRHFDSFLKRSHNPIAMAQVKNDYFALRASMIASATVFGASAYFNGSIEYDARP